MIPLRKFVLHYKKKNPTISCGCLKDDGFRIVLGLLWIFQLRPEDVHGKSSMDQDVWISCGCPGDVDGLLGRFVRNSRPRQPCTTGPLTSEELRHAETIWLSHVQTEAFRHDILALTHGSVAAASSSLRVFQPFLDASGILSVGGRFHQLQDSYQTKHPILLPPKHRFTELIILDAHQRFLHASVQDTIAEVRSTFWVVRGRQTTRRVLHSCLTCRRLSAHLETAPVSPLPRERITPANPFTVVGVDFAGPLYISRSASPKTYVALFTCGVTRAVHLELVSSMSVPDFLLAFRRFISRRGVPSLIFSDNARTFRKCLSLLSLVSARDVLDFATLHRIVRRFIVERAPWWGGWWERLIRTVKEALRRCLGRKRLTI
ncbi:uncharacterized protein LOC135369147 [Ornithodoros turicata]|uniref:uncharacterized protein LOC135369147 n=1 Tax=Ornithodoros turicata TaxID=34597 RepID=UPI003138CD18